LEEGRQKRPQRAGGRCPEDHERYQAEGGQPASLTDEAGDDRARHQLTFGTDVPEPGAEGDGDREPGEKEGRRFDQRVLDIVSGLEGGEEKEAVGGKDSGTGGGGAA